MKKINEIFNAIFLLVLITLLVNMDTREVSLQAQWEQEIGQNHRESDKTLLKDRYVIFVSGIMGNELANLIGNYFPDNIETVKNELGGMTSYISPSCNFSIPENSFKLNKKINEINAKKKILVGHSKGGAELLHWILLHPEEIIYGAIEQVLLIQPAIGGSPLIDMSDGILYDIFLALFDPNLETLSTRQAKIIFDDAFVSYEKRLKEISKTSGLAYEKLHDIVSSRIFYVVSTVEPGYESFALSLILTVLKSSLNSLGIAHDGLLPKSSQYDVRIGKILGTLNIDHVGLVVSTLSNVSKEARTAFTRLIFRIMAEHLTKAPAHL